VELVSVRRIGYWHVISCLSCFTSFFFALAPCVSEVITEQSAPGVEVCTQREQ